MKSGSKKTISLLLVAFLAIGSFTALSTEETYAASKKPAKVSGLTVKKAGKNKVKLTWKKARYAKKYQIYYSLSDNYSCIKTTSSKSCTLDQEPGVKFKYKVRAINGKSKGNFSSVKSISLPLKYYSEASVPDFGWIFDLKPLQYTAQNDTFLYQYLDDNTFIDVLAYVIILKSNGFTLSSTEDECSYYINARTNILVQISYPSSLLVGIGFTKY